MVAKRSSTPGSIPRVSKLSGCSRSASTAALPRAGHTQKDDGPSSARTYWERRRRNSSPSRSLSRPPSKEPGEGIRTAVRVRSFSDGEQQPREGGAVFAEGQTLVLDMSKELLRFSFDHIFGTGERGVVANASQEDIFKYLGEPLLRGALAGDSGWMIAIGEAGAGKSHSIVGSTDQPGVLPRFVQKLSVERSSPQGHDTRLWLSALEINDEYVRDLLSTGGEDGHSSDQPSFVEHPTLGVQVVGLQQVPCPDLDEFWNLLAYASKKRALSSTCVNGKHTESHIVFLADLDVYQGRRVSHARLGLAEVCASVQTYRRRPSRPVVALGVLVRELVEASSSRSGVDPLSITRHLPFNTAKLTLALKDALISGVRTYVMAAISPSRAEVVQSQAVLQLVELIRGLRQNPKPRVLEHSQHGHQEQVNRQLSPDEVLRRYQHYASEHRRLLVARQRALEARGVATNDAQEALAPEQVTPYLLNMSDDPMLAGTLVFLLRCGEPTHIGSDRSNAIVIEGLGVAPELCQVTNHDNVMVSLQRSESLRRRVLLNGLAVPAECASVELRHHDRLCLGRAMVLRLYVPMHAQVATIDESVEFTGGQTPARFLHELVIRDSVRELLPVLPEQADSFTTLQPYMDHSESMGELQLYVKDLLGKFDPQAGRVFFDTLLEACSLVDEANMIAHEVRPQDRLRVEVEFVWDIYRAAHEVVMIRLLKYDNFHEHGDILTYWTYARFRERIANMRKIHHVFYHKGTWSGWGDPFEDPWEEPHLVDYYERQLLALVAERRRTMAMVAQRSSSPKRNGPATLGSGSGAVSMPSPSEPGAQAFASFASNTNASRVKTPRTVSSSGRATGSDLPRMRVVPRTRTAEVATPGDGGGANANGATASKSPESSKAQARAAHLEHYSAGGPEKPPRDTDTKPLADVSSTPPSPSSGHPSQPTPREEHSLHACEELPLLLSVGESGESEQSHPVRSARHDGDQSSEHSCETAPQPSPHDLRLSSSQRQVQALAHGAPSASTTAGSSCIASPQSASSTPLMPVKVSDSVRCAYTETQPLYVPHLQRHIRADQPQARIASPTASPLVQSRQIVDRARSGSASPPSARLSTGALSPKMPNNARLHHVASAPWLPAPGLPMQQSIGYQLPRHLGVAVVQPRLGYPVMDHAELVSPRPAIVRRDS